jgi:hypothetical protein
MLSNPHVITLRTIKPIQGLASGIGTETPARKFPPETFLAVVPGKLYYPEFHATVWGFNNQSSENEGYMARQVSHFQNSILNAPLEALVPKLSFCRSDMQLFIHQG